MKYEKNKQNLFQLFIPLNKKQQESTNETIKNIIRLLGSELQAQKYSFLRMIFGLSLTKLDFHANWFFQISVTVWTRFNTLKNVCLNIFSKTMKPNDDTLFF